MKASKHSTKPARSMGRGSKVRSYATAKEELDTYDLSPRELKEKISPDQVLLHWEKRAKRPGVQAVMSARHSLEENKAAADILKRDIFRFLDGLADDATVFELGYGIGRMTAELCRRAKWVSGIDLSRAMADRASANLAGFANKSLEWGKVTDMKVNERYDLVFVSIVLLHILNPKELQVTIAKLQELSDTVFIVEHTYEGPDFPISKYSILRQPEEYAQLFAPYRLIRQKDVKCVGDRFTMMLFQK